MRGYQGYRLTFDDVREEYPDYLAELSDEIFEIEADGDWDGSTWKPWQQAILQGYIDDEKRRRAAVAEAADLEDIGADLG